MTPDQVIDIRREWGRFNYGPILPSATVLATHDWLAYVHAMAAAIPSGETITFPSEADVAWAWPDGVCIVFAEPFTLEHTIISQERGYGLERVAPHVEQQTVRGLVILPTRLMATQTRTGEPLPEQLARPVMWIGNDSDDIVSASWLPDTVMHANIDSDLDSVSASSRMLLSVITALGHRLTRIDQPITAGRGERRRIARELPLLRVLQLATGATVSKSEGTGSVEWSRRWMVRGHWRLQPYGPQRTLRKAIWIDPYVKGPEDKPLDVRDTLWTTGHARPD